MDATDRINKLLDEGLDHYGRGLESEAVRCWRAVLELDSQEPHALDYLRAAGISMSIAPPKMLVDQVKLERFMALSRYDSALNLLTDARARGAGDPGLDRGIRVLEATIERRVQELLGDLEQVPRVCKNICLPTLDLDQASLMDFVDGSATYAQILERSDLGRHATAQGIAQLSKLGLVVVDNPLEGEDRDLGLHTALESIRDQHGYEGCCVVDTSTRRILYVDPQNVQADHIAEGATRAVRAYGRLSQGSDDPIEDLIINQGKRRHLLRMLPRSPEVVIYVMLDRAEANLAMAQLVLASLCSRLERDPDRKSVVEIDAA